MLTYRVGCLISVLGAELAITSLMRGIALDMPILLMIGSAALVMNTTCFGKCLAHVIPIKNNS